jgi:hypothetical protein
LACAAAALLTQNVLKYRTAANINPKRLQKPSQGCVLQMASRQTREHAYLWGCDVDVRQLLGNRAEHGVNVIEVVRSRLGRRRVLKKKAPINFLARKKTDFFPWPN